jgi:hypothetical protein
MRVGWLNSWKRFTTTLRSLRCSSSVAVDSIASLTAALVAQELVLARHHQRQAHDHAAPVRLTHEPLEPARVGPGDAPVRREAVRPRVDVGETAVGALQRQADQVDAVRRVTVEVVDEPLRDRGAHQRVVHSQAPQLDLLAAQPALAAAQLELARRDGLDLRLRPARRLQRMLRERRKREQRHHHELPRVHQRTSCTWRGNSQRPT